MSAALACAPGMRLRALLEDIVAVPAAQDCAITGLALDSRRVRRGDLYLALPGTRTDGARFAADAVAAGAVVVLVDAALALPALPVPAWQVADLRGAAGQIADRFHGRPSAQLEVIGITGTNGKTSVSHFLGQALARCAVMGTEGSGFLPRLTPNPRTTPDVLEVHALLAGLRAAGARAVAMEVSSHALDQGRVAGVRFAAAVYTNLGHDHLDYHGDLERYGAAKAALFRLPDLGGAVVNAADALGARILAGLPAGLARVSYGTPDADLHAAVTPTDAGLELAIGGRHGQARLALPLLGRFNAGNVLAVLGVALLRGAPLAEACARLAGLTPPPGRMQALRAPGRPLVVVDYAHNPPALEAVLAALREHLGGAGRLHCVFGCGGERDRAKRPLMGALAARLADAVLLTDDNPRHEDPRAIVAGILAGMPASAPVCHDRAQAIARAIAQAGPHDVVLIAGKGAEAYQECAGERRPFSDYAAAAAVLGLPA